MLSRFPRLKMLLPLLLLFFVTLVALRVGFYFYFLADKLDQPTDVILKALSIGIRFDLRIAVLMLLPLAITSFMPRWFGLRGAFGSRLALVCSTLAVAAVTFFYITDFAHYSYLDERLNASVLRFAEDGFDSVQMVWESYPVLWLVLLLLLATVSGAWLFSGAIRRYRGTRPIKFGVQFVVVSALMFPLTVFAIMGKVGETIPLRWSDAYFSGNQDVAALGLNPIVFFFDTLSNQTRPYDENKLREHYQLVADYLGVDQPDSNTFSFSRQVKGKPRAGKLPNVVFIHLESLGANRSGLYGNPLEATTRIDQAARDGIFFPNFMVPSSGTARTVFGLITGIPDVTWGGSTATRNPLIANQYTLVNAFAGYNKLYFIGGDAGWANIKGLLESGIDGLELWEEKDYDAPSVDVWGVSDRDLFSAAHKRLNALPDDKPFVAFIQLAANHRPFTIPDDNSGFISKVLPESEVQKYGFLGLDQYNAVRLMDFNIRYYLDELVANSHYANNTIFVMYGDHNDRSNHSVHMGYSEKLVLDKHHVPMFIYAPGIIETPQVIEQATSLVDIMPTTLGLIGLPYENRTLGRDMLSWDKESYAVTFGGDRSNRPLIGLLDQDYLLSMYYDGSDAHLYPLKDASFSNDVFARQPEAASQRKAMLDGIYQAARYMLEHNRKDKK